MSHGPRGPRREQVAALPWRASPETGLQILLITSRQAQRWILPKGWLMAGKSAAEAAAQEAYEEAGVKGVISPAALGAYRIEKRLSGKNSKTVEVQVFTLEVLLEVLTWPEHHERERRWLQPKAAIGLVDDPDLAGLLERFAQGWTAA